MKEKYFEVTKAGASNFYDTMVGKLVFETDRTYLLEFNFNELLGGVQRVMFFKHQVEEYPMG